MIGHLRGTALDTTLLEVGGVGYVVHATEDLQPGCEYRLHIHTVVREDALELYGFAEPTEKALFLLLIKAPKIGAKIALTILRTLGAAGTARALDEKDDAALATVPGIGLKSAQNLLQNITITPELAAALNPAAPGERAPRADELVDALTNMGFERARAEKALAATHATEDPGARIRKAVLAMRGAA